MFNDENESSEFIYLSRDDLIKFISQQRGNISQQRTEINSLADSNDCLQAELTVIKREKENLYNRYLPSPLIGAIISFCSIFIYKLFVEKWLILTVNKLHNLYLAFRKWIRNYFPSWKREGDETSSKELIYG